MRFFRATLVLTLALAGAPSMAQPPPDPSDGVVVRETSQLGWLDHLTILTKRAFVPGSQVVAPLHSYAHEPACDQEQAAPLIGHEGPAALVTQLDGTVVAIYYRTVGHALRAARDYGWCNSSANPSDAWRPDSWAFATTFPVPTWDAHDHYVSLDIDRVEASMQATDPEPHYLEHLGLPQPRQ